jgi:hypothetical protein
MLPSFAKFASLGKMCSRTRRRYWRNSIDLSTVCIAGRDVMADLHRDEMNIASSTSLAGVLLGNE